MGLFSDKIYAAKQLIEEYNQKLEATRKDFPFVEVNSIDAEKFVERLVLYGGVADEFLRQCRWEDLENCGIPRLQAQKMVKIFRSDKV